MSGFSGSWLRLREPADAAARSRALVERLRQVLPERPLRITDLATGTGANLRYLGPALRGAQEWHLIDHDAALLAELPARIAEWAHACHSGLRVTEGGIRVDGPGFECHMRHSCEDLALRLHAVELPPDSLVSASALLDLVSAPWLQMLARHCASARATALFALTYDGRMSFEPREPEDTLVTTLVNRHQLTDKGFGSALGPAATATAVQAFEPLGYRIVTAPSDWRLGPDDSALQQALLEGWAHAAREVAPAHTLRLRRWLERRRKHVSRGVSAIAVGHQDLLAWLPR